MLLHGNPNHAAADVTVVVLQQQNVYRNGQQFLVDSQLQHYGYHAGYAGPEFAPYGMPGSTFYDQVHAYQPDAAAQKFPYSQRC